MILRWRCSYAIHWVAGPIKGQRTDVSSQMKIGRSPENEIVLPVNTAGVSGKHCAVAVSDDKFYVMDLGSTYGTVANGSFKLPPNQAVILNVGDRISLGSENVAFEIIRNDYVLAGSGVWQGTTLGTAGQYDRSIDFGENIVQPGNAPLYEDYSQAGDVSQPKAKGKSKWIIPVAILAAVLIIVAVVLGLGVGRKSGDSQKSGTPSSDELQEEAPAEESERATRRRQRAGL